jgi:hypothetical protein
MELDHFDVVLELDRVESRVIAIISCHPMDGETVTDALPEIKANLATLGNVDPKSVTMRISGLGLVPATL